MINRALIRTKVVQIVYSYLIDGDKILPRKNFSQVSKNHMNCIIYCCLFLLK